MKGFHTTLLGAHSSADRVQRRTLPWYHPAGCSNHDRYGDYTAALNFERLRENGLCIRQTTKWPFLWSENRHATERHRTRNPDESKHNDPPVPEGLADSFRVPAGLLIDDPEATGTWTGMPVGYWTASRTFFFETVGPRVTMRAESKNDLETAIALASQDRLKVVIASRTNLDRIQKAIRSLRDRRVWVGMW